MNSYFLNRIIVAGTRQWEDKRLFKRSIDAALGRLTGRVLFISGGCPSGPDDIIVRYCKTYKRDILIMPAQWDLHGRSAGMVRNSEMAKIATGLIAFWDMESPGTRHMIETMKKQSKPVWVTSTKEKP